MVLLPAVLPPNKFIYIYHRARGALCWIFRNGGFLSERAVKINCVLAAKELGDQKVLRKVIGAKQEYERAVVGEGS